MVDLTQGEVTGSPHGSPHPITSAEAISIRVNRRMAELAGSRYFRLCRSGEFTRGQLLRVVEQLYCFSVLFERILTRRLSALSSRSPEALVRLARQHLQEEIGHCELFRRALLENGLSPEDIRQLAPTAHTKALFGYLLATVEYEHELVTNVAIMQVMELIGLHFFELSLGAMERHGLDTSAVEAHAEDDRAHCCQGLELCNAMDERLLADAARIIDDLFRLMAFVLDEWSGPAEPRDDATDLPPARSQWSRAQTASCPPASFSSPMGCT